MPQFDPAVFSAQIFWLFIFFTILMVYTVSVSIPRLKQLLEERWNRTEGYRIEAERLAEEKEATLYDVEGKLNKSRQKAHDIITATLSDVDKDLSERKKAMVSLLRKQLEATEASLAEEKEKAVFDIEKHTQIITHDIIGKILPMALKRRQTDSNPEVQGAVGGERSHGA